MAIIRDRELIEDLDNVPVPLVQSCVKEHRAGVPRLNQLESYYLGKHPILNRRSSVSSALPNNRIVANHAKYITDIAVGYVMGNPVKYEGASIDELLKVFDRIDIVSHDAELAKDLSIFGEAREIYFMTGDDNPIPKVSVIDPRQTFLVVDDSVEYRPLFGVHYYPKRNAANEAIGYTIDVYGPRSKKRYFVRGEDPAGTDYAERELPGMEAVHHFGGIPIVEYWNNEERQGDFEQQISLIDAYNVLQSDRVNDKEQLVDALLKVTGMSFGDDTEEAVRTIRILKELKVLEMPHADADADWLVKQLNETEVEVLRKALRDDIHQFAMVPNLTDKEFASQASGVAMKYKLLGLEQLAKNKERYFVQGLRERLQLFANILTVKGKAVDVSSVDITMTRNLPANDLDTAQTISLLDGLVSRETLLSRLSFVDDPAAEAKAVETQKAADIKLNQMAFGLPMSDDAEEE